MSKLLRFLRSATEVLTTAGAVLAAAVVVVETYQALRKTIDSDSKSLLPTRQEGRPTR
jgi:hypothetical protein